MFSFNEKKRRTLIVILFLFWISIIGCDKKRDYDRGSGQMLSKEQILKVANRKARSVNIPPKESNALYDVEEAKWKENLELMEKLSPGWSKEFEVLNGRDYVIVLIRPEGPRCIGWRSLAIYRQKDG